MKTFQLTAKKKITLALLVVIALALVIFIVNVQRNQPDNLPANYMERLKNPGMTGDYIGLWKSATFQWRRLGALAHNAPFAICAIPIAWD